MVLNNTLVCLNCRYLTSYFIFLVFYSDATGFSLLRDVFFLCVIAVFIQQFVLLCVSVCVVSSVLLPKINE